MLDLTYEDFELVISYFKYVKITRINYTKN